MTTAADAMMVDVAEVRRRLRERSDTVVVDVRSPAEFDAVSIVGSVNLPLDRLDAVGVIGPATRPMVLVCRSGARATRAAEILVARDLASDVVVMRGGLNAWVESGGPVERAGPSTWTLERQVRLVAGGIVASSIAASIRFPRARYLAGAVGLGLVTAAVTDTCAMGELLMRLPYNRRSAGRAGP